MASNPVDVIIVDGVPVTKSDVRAYEKLRVRKRMGDATEVRNTRLSGQYGGLYISSLQSNFDLDAADTTTPDDGATCIIDFDGNRFKKVNGAGSGLPGGTDRQVQFNNLGNFGGSASFVWDGAALRVPKAVGGTGAGSSLELQSTTGVGTTDFIRALVGSNGATEAWRVLTDGSVGIGTPTPLAKFTINRNAVVTVPSPGSNVVMHIVGADTQSTQIIMDSFSAGPGFFSRRSGGTLASPSAIASGNSIGSFNSAGRYDASNYSGVTGSFNFMAEENFTSTAWGTKFTLGTTPIGGPVRTVGLTQWGSAGVSIGSALSDPGTGNLSVAGAIQTGSFTVATLPAGVAGRMVYCSNCRVFNGAGTQESGGAGTGGHVSYNGFAWKIAGTNVTAVA